MAEASEKLAVKKGMIGLCEQGLDTSFQLGATLFTHYGDLGVCHFT